MEGFDDAWAVSSGLIKPGVTIGRGPQAGGPAAGSLLFPLTSRSSISWPLGAPASASSGRPVLHEVPGPAPAMGDRGGMAAVIFSFVRQPGGDPVRSPRGWGPGNEAGAEARMERPRSS